MKNQLYFILACILFCSCSSTELVHISVQEPAPVTLPPSIKQVAVINRTLPAKDTKLIDAVDKVFTLEGKNLDKEGAQATINGLSDELMKNNRFTQIKPLNDLELRTIGAGLFPTPLDWETVEKICKENQVDALFALEMFDTDTKINFGVNPTSLSTPIGIVSAVQQQSNILTTVKTGWRIYDPATHDILDEYPITRSISHSSVGINPAVPAAAIAGRKDAVKEAGNEIGHTYALRIIPYWIRVTRDYFVRGSDNFRIARRMAQTGNWNDAAALWQKETQNPNPKVAGRACYNMAIINEINGDLDAAIGWAQKGYENYYNRLSLWYVNVLKNRAANMALVKNQTEQQ